MDDTSTLTTALSESDEEILMHDIPDEALEASAGTTRLFTAMITDCPTIVAACCGGRF